MRDLTTRQLEVLKIVAEGVSNKEVARRLGIKVSTIQRHVQDILASLEVSSRTAASVVALQEGLFR